MAESIEQYLKLAFTAKELPVTQQYVDIADEPSPGEMEIFGKMTVPQAHIYHHIFQLQNEAKVIIEGLKSVNDLSGAQTEELHSIGKTIEFLITLMWKLVHDDFPQVRNASTFGRTTILHNWQVAGVYLTPDEAELQGFESRLFQIFSD